MTASHLTAAPGSISRPTGNRRAAIYLDLQQFKVMPQVGGKEALMAVEKVKPGEIIEYRLKCVNGTGGRITNVQPRLPLPVGLAFVPPSTNIQGVEASRDGKSWGAIPLTRKVKFANGEEKSVAVPYSQYRFLRWTLAELGAGQSVTLTARARVLSPNQN